MMRRGVKGGIQMRRRSKRGRWGKRGNVLGGEGDVIERLGGLF